MAETEHKDSDLDRVDSIDKASEDLNKTNTNDHDEKSHRATSEHDLEKNETAEDITASAKKEQTQSDEDFSSFTVSQRRWIILSASLIAFLSPMTGSIYYPALNVIAKDLNVSDTDINLTVTTYLIFQGLGPMIIAQFSDKVGRRPAYIFCFIVYLAANLGLSLQNSYVALLILRMVQSAGSSGTVTLANGVVGDLVTSSERGQYIAFASVGTLAGPTISPIIGGLLSEYLNWHWIFWFLLILSGVLAVPFLLFFPETCRNIVGDGSIPPPTLSWNLTDHLRFRRRERQGIPINTEKAEALRKNHKFSFPNPLATLIVLTNPEAALLLLCVGIAFSCIYAISTGASVALTESYGLNQLDIGLVFISLGAGCVLSAFITGKLVDLNYIRYARKLNFPICKNRQTDISKFPIERARLEPSFFVLLFGAAAIIGYGWLLTADVSLAGPVVMLFVLGFCLMAGWQCINVLIIDIYPGKPATATAANNVVRCLLAAGASAAIEPMCNALGYGLAYTILALIFMLSCFLLIPVATYGIQLRQRLKENDERRARRKAEKLAKADNKH